MKETTLEKRLKREVEKAGGKAYKFVSPGYAGVPDRLVCLPNGRGIIFVEMKQPKGRPSPMQEFRIAEIRKMGYRVEMIRNDTQLDEFLKEVRLGI